MPRGWRGVVAGFEAVARVGIRTMRRLAGKLGWGNLREEDEEEKDVLGNDDVSPERKVEEMRPVVAAMSFSLLKG